jgi:hypothetical protein
MIAQEVQERNVVPLQDGLTPIASKLHALACSPTQYLDRIDLGE